jgi:signal transduction histidine kinase
MTADKIRVRQIVYNLLSNAAKFTKGGRVTFAATESVVSGTKLIRFTVQDTGIGISEPQKSRLFKDFSQADASMSRKLGGTGLGMAITRRICELMGGEITLESELGKGSVFTVTLPFHSTVTVEPLSKSNQQQNLHYSNSKNLMAPATLSIHPQDRRKEVNNKDLAPQR